MGRGYSATRSTSRPVGGGKRKRSLSIVKLREKIEAVQAEGGKVADIEEEDIVASEAEEETVVVPDVLNRYKTAGKIVDAALNAVCAACVVGANTFDLCNLGDDAITEGVKKVFNNKKDEQGKRIKKGICYPTNISVNNVLCNHAPFNKEEAVELHAGDVVKVHLGCHVDGYPACAARTIHIGDTAIPAHATTTVAAQIALAGMIRMMRPGAENHDVSKYIDQVAEHFSAGGTPIQIVEGCLSNRTKRWIIDGSSCIIARRVILEEPQQDVAPCTIEQNQVWTLDVAMTNAPNYRVQLYPGNVNVFRRNEVAVNLRLSAATHALENIRETFQCFPFTPLRLWEPLRARLGLTALRKNDMLDLFPALQCKNGFVTSRFSCTVIVSQNKVSVVCGDPIVSEHVASLAPSLSPALQQAVSAPMTFSAQERARKRRTLDLSSKGALPPKSQ